MRPFFTARARLFLSSYTKKGRTQPSAARTETLRDLRAEKPPAPARLGRNQKEFPTETAEATEVFSVLSVPSVV
jgi:hypothetical protein